MNGCLAKLDQCHFLLKIKIIKDTCHIKDTGIYQSEYVTTIMKRQKYICRACSSLLFKIFPARGSKLKHLKFSPQSHFLFSAPLPFKRGAFYGISVWIFKNVSKHLSKSLNCGFSTTLIKVLLTFKVRTDNTGITPLLLFGFLSYQQSEIKKAFG